MFSKVKLHFKLEVSFRVFPSVHNNACWSSHDREVIYRLCLVDWFGLYLVARLQTNNVVKCLTVD